MGCDIHIVLERREVNSPTWIGLWSTDAIPGGRPFFAQRDYGLFQRFGVRGYREDGAKVIYPRNVPRDVSDLSWAQYMRSPTDHHSASHATPQEFAEAWLAEHPDSDKVRQEHALWDLFRIDPDWPEDAEYRLVFWFDN